MNVSIKNEYRVEAVLTSRELSEYGITYEEFDYKNIETRRVLWTILDEIKNRYGVKLSFAGKLLIEVIKEAEDKYRLCFSSLPPHSDDGKSIKQLIKTENQPLIAEFESFEDVLSAIFAMCTLKTDATELYEKNGRYRMLFFADTAEKANVNLRICEFGNIVCEPLLEKARCEEHWSCIVKHDAVNKLITAFSESR